MRFAPLEGWEAWKLGGKKQMKDGYFFILAFQHPGFPASQHLTFKP